MNYTIEIYLYDNKLIFTGTRDLYFEKYKGNGPGVYSQPILCLPSSCSISEIQQALLTCVGVLDLTGIRCGVGDDAAGDARKLILRAQARHIGLPLDGNAVEAADGMRCLFGQLFRENMCVDVMHIVGK